MKIAHKNCDFNETLFIVYTPFQCLCALEAIYQYGIDNYSFWLININSTRKKQLIKLLQKKNIPYTIVDQFSIFNFPFKLGSPHKKFNTIFIGDYYFGLGAYAWSAVIAKRNANIFYLDDGASTLNILAKQPIKRKTTIIGKLIKNIYHITLKLKNVDERNFFTIFDVKSNVFNVYKNELSSIRTLKSANDNKVYIIGTKSSVLSFENYSYIQLLQKLLSYIRVNYGNAPIAYCPHGGDRNNEQNFAFCKDNGIEIFNTEITVECDFSTKNIYPNTIFGFNSTALFSLHLLYPDTEIYNIHFELTDKNNNSEHQELFDYYSRQGIKLIHL